MTPAEELKAAVLEAHHTAAMSNGNVSSELVKVYAQAGVPFQQAVVAAISSLGGLHAPVTQARRVIYYPENHDIEAGLDAGYRIAGFGNSFYRDQADPAWSDAASVVTQEYPYEYKRLWELSLQIQTHKKRPIYPNAAAYTAICAHNLARPWGTEMSLVLEGRIGAWGTLYDASRGPVVWDGI